MKFNKQIITIILALMLVVVLPLTSFAETTITYGTNGAAGKYGAGSELVLVGKVTDGTTVLANTEVTITVTSGSKEIHFEKQNSDSKGYFRTAISIPKSVTASLVAKIEAAGKTESYTIALKTPDSVDLLGFVDYAGYLENGTVSTIPASAGKLGILFSSNVNYYNNKDINGDLGLDSLGINERNEDCFKLYKKSSSGSFDIVGCSVDLVDSAAQGDNIIDKGKVTLLPGKTISGGGNQGSNVSRKNVVYVVPDENFTPDTTYKLVVDGRLSANHSGTLGTTTSLFFTTAKGSEPSTGGTGGGGGGSLSEAPKENNLTVQMKPAISGNTATVAPSDAQLDTVLKDVKSGQDNIAVFELGEIAADQKVGKVVLELTGAQMTKLGENIDKVRCSTPFGTVLLPASVVKQTKGNVSLTLEKVDGKADTFTVSLKDSSGAISILDGRVALTLPVESKSSNVVKHNDTIMKNALINNGKLQAVTKGFSTFAATENTVTFSDVSSHWAKKNIEFLAARNIVNGVEVDRFAPNSSVTRAEFVKMLVNSLDELSSLDAASASFSDVKDDAWYADYVNWAAANGVVSGMGNGTFGTNSSITRQDMAVMIDRFARKMNITLYAATQKTEFSDDADISDYSKDAVYRMQQAGIISGTGQNQFNPKGNATRAEVAKMIHLIIEKMIVV